MTATNNFNGEIKAILYCCLGKQLADKRVVKCKKK